MDRYHTALAALQAVQSIAGAITLVIFCRMARRHEANLADLHTHLRFTETIAVASEGPLRAHTIHVTHHTQDTAWTDLLVGANGLTFRYPLLPKERDDLITWLQGPDGPNWPSWPDEDAKAAAADYRT